MMAPDFVSLLQGANRLPFDGVEDKVGSFLPVGAESHRVFGAGLLFVGCMLLVETLAGRVWFRSRLRALIWPAAVMALGLGMFAVAYIDSNQKPVHFLVGVLLLAAGVFEARYRLGRIPRARADLLIIAAIFFAGVLMGPVHAGAAMATVGGQTHMLIGVTGMGLAGIRAAQAVRPRSANLGATFGTLVIATALQFLLMSGHHH